MSAQIKTALRALAAALEEDHLDEGTAVLLVLATRKGGQIEYNNTWRSAMSEENDQSVRLAVMESMIEDAQEAHGMKTEKVFETKRTRRGGEDDEE